MHTKNTRGDKWQKRVCEHCGAIFDYLPGQGQGRFCTKKCWYLSKRKPWKDANGYIHLRTDNRHVLEHRLVMSKHLGRSLRPDEHIHHINGDTSDNRIENLQVMSHSEHMRLHNTVTRVTRTCQNCGISFTWRPGYGKGLYCSQACHYAHMPVVGVPSRRKPRIERACQSCGKLFQWLPGRGQGLCCSDACAQQYRRSRLNHHGRIL